ncbi:MAG: SEC-C metal-binding domain-containing protein, partial [Hyphomonadaceae bacterium]
KTEAFTLFESLLNDLRRGVTRILMRAEFGVEAAGGQAEGAAAPGPLPSARPSAVASSEGAGQTSPENMPADPSWANTPRNAPCPCGSGKRYKNCHGDVSVIARA